jgi:hypothetical protein
MWMRILVSVCLLAFTCLMPGFAQQDEQRLPVKPAGDADLKPAEVPPPVIYRPPLRGAPKTRVAGGTRAPVQTRAAVQVLGPEHTGRTATDRPVLFWYLSEDVELPIELTLIDDYNIPPLVRTRLEGSKPAGIHAWSLAGEGARLVAGRSYQWSVAIVVDPERRSRDVFSSARFRYQPLEDGKTIASLADQGCWYDAFAESARQFAAGDEHRMADVMGALLTQVGLREIPPRILPAPPAAR